MIECTKVDQQAMSTTTLRPTSLGRAVSADVAHAPAAVAGLGAGGGAVPGHVPHLVAVVARVLLLAAVPGDVAAAVALVAPVLLLAALPGEVPEPVALVALAAATSAESSGHAAAAAASAVTVHATIALGTLASKVAYSVTPAAAALVMVWQQWFRIRIPPVTDRPTTSALSPVSIRALAGEMSSPTNVLLKHRNITRKLIHY